MFLANLITSMNNWQYSDFLPFLDIWFSSQSITSNDNLQKSMVNMSLNNWNSLKQNDNVSKKRPINQIYFLFKISKFVYPNRYHAINFITSTFFGVFVIIINWWFHISDNFLLFHHWSIPFVFLKMRKLNHFKRSNF